jgi:hypothetical protein
MELLFFFLEIYDRGGTLVRRRYARHVFQHARNLLQLWYLRGGDIFDSQAQLFSGYTSPVDPYGLLRRENSPRENCLPRLRLASYCDELAEIFFRLGNFPFELEFSTRIVGIAGEATGHEDVLVSQQFLHGAKDRRHPSLEQQRVREQDRPLGRACPAAGQYREKPF